MSGTLYGIGIGPGDPDLITLKAVRILQQVDLVVFPAPEHGSSLARRIAAPHLPGRCAEFAIRIPMAAARFPPDHVYDDAARRIGAELDAGRSVAALCEGDPFFYGSFAYLFARLAGSHRVEVIPGVSSLTACAARLGIPLAARNDVLTVIPAPLADTVITRQLEDTDAAAIVKLGRHFARIRALLVREGLDSRSAYVEHATMGTERLIPLARVEAATVPYFSMILFHRRGRAWN